MCGIAALIQPGRHFAEKLLDAVDADLFHRGPDAGGRLTEPGVALVHRRLAILDPTEGANQPMTDPDGRCTLIYNGEIYNYRAVRAELEQAGVRLRTDGDSEAILMGYLQWGEGVLDRLEGMYAFAILDRPNNRLLAARDPLGIKPLYLYRRDGLAMLASEVRPMRHVTALEPDPAALAELVNYRWAAGRLSNFKGVDRVPGGTILTVSLADGAVTERRFCDPLETLHDEAMSAKEAEERARAALLASIEGHLASDVGYTMQLSGGVDSSLIASVTAGRTEGRLKSFALHLPGFEHDEKRWRDQLLAGHDFAHEEVTVGGRDFADALPRAVMHMEGPSPHLGCVLLMRLCDTITRHGKVVLTGEGADEFFGGYLRYARWPKTAWQERLARWLPAGMFPNRWPFAGIKRLAGVDAAAFGGVYHDIQAMRSLFPGLTPVPGARETVSGRFGRFVDRLFAVDQTAYLESLLVRQDKMAMAASVEARVPFVHMPLARVLNRIPRRLLAPGDGQTKPLLKKIAEDYVPHDILYRRKVGLRLPVGEWLADDTALGRFLPDLTESDARLADYTDRSRLRQAVEDFRAGQPGAAQIVMQLVNLETWLRNLPPSPGGSGA